MDTSQVSTGSAFAIEFVTDFAVILLSFGVGLDPRQKGVFGPTLGPIFVGIPLALCIFSTGIIRPGYTGFCMGLTPCDSGKTRDRYANNEKQQGIPRDASGQWSDLIFRPIIGYSG